MKLSSRSCVVSHGGAGNSADVADGCARASDVGLVALAGGANPLDAAVASVIVLEDDPRMNAGTGAVLRLDGKAQLDAAVMDQNGFGAVAVVDDWKNPVKLARAVYDTPHMMIAGPGGNELAQRLGLEKAAPITPEQRARHAERVQGLDTNATWQRMYGGVDPRVWRDVVKHGAGGSDTVGAVVRSHDGSFAAASSTGGIWCAIKGRVGDAPIPGAGLYAGPAGAVCATGVGEYIWREMMSVRLYDELARGVPAQHAVDAALRAFFAKHPGIEVGLIAVDAIGSGGGSTATMPWSAKQAP